MNKNTQENTIKRSDFLHMLQVASEVKSVRFLKDASIHWLAVHPNDLSVRLEYANALRLEGKESEYEAEIFKLIQSDPLFVDAYKSLKAYKKSAMFTLAQLDSILFVLGVNPQLSESIMPWAITLGKARDLIKANAFDDALENVNEILNSEDYPVLLAIIHSQLVQATQTAETTLHLAQIYSDRWPECIHFSLITANSLIKTQQESEATRILHGLVDRDPAGQAADELWGKENPFANLWPKDLSVVFDLPIPADVASVLGSNILAGGAGEPEPEHGLGSDFCMHAEIQDEEKEQANQGSIGHKPDIEEAEPPASQRMDLPPEITGLIENLKTRRGKEASQMMLDVFDEVNSDEKEEENAVQKLAKKLGKSDLEVGNTRFPVYVILSSHRNLVKTYGEKSAEVIEEQMNRLADSVKHHPGWSALAFLPDDQTCMDQYNLKAADTVDPWQIKLALADLDKMLIKKGMMIGALLIVGGDEIVPFHRLPNPTNDTDGEVLSDNPYATPEANYFIPLWMTGRFPSEAAKDAGLLISQIHKSIRYHEMLNKKHPQWAMFWRYMNSVVSGNGTVLDKVKYRNVGYTAAVWRRSSLASFRPVGEGRDMLVSPPESTVSINRQKLASSPIGYYNLHGLADSSEWYGQKDPNEKKELPDFPVALTPADLDGTNSIPKLVFSEACYGAYTNSKTEDGSVALKFIARGAISFVGSTCVSYGSISTPLISADLLGNLFWKFIKEGLSTGEALMKAKIELVREMNKRQGFLDGEDQKTLISFVLFGDPLVCKQINSNRKKALVRSSQTGVIKIICDAEPADGELRESAGEAIAQAKDLLADHLPGLGNAELRTFTNNQSETLLTGSKNVMDMGKAVQQVKTANRNIVVFSKQMDVNNHKITQYARLTIDNAGKLVKMSVSR